MGTVGGKGGVWSLLAGVDSRLLSDLLLSPLPTGKIEICKKKSHDNERKERKGEIFSDYY